MSRSAPVVGPPAPPEAVPRPYLEIRQEGAPPVRKALAASGDKTVFVVGRAAGCDVPLNHPSVSRRHAELVRDAQGRWLVRDLRSRNGTLVNESAVVGEQLLRPGDVLQIGQFAVRLF